MDYNKMSKKELIGYIQKLINQRAFTYEDQMKLAILDKSPFTIWASDRDCKIKLWTGKCEELYGHSSKTALERDFVDFFVAPDEQRAARIDCVDIIDKGTLFHNIANDKGRYGTIELLTNCFRVKDVRTGEYLQAEMGLIISFLEQERERLITIIEESKKIEGLIKNFLAIVQKKKKKFKNKRKAIYSAIKDAEKKAIKDKKRTEFKKKTTPFFSQIIKIRDDLSQIVLDLLEKIQGCATSDACKNVIEKLEHHYDETDTKFIEIKLDVDEFLLSLEHKNNKRFKIALSFPGEYREDIIDNIAEGLAKKFSKKKILYDLFHQAEFAMPNLDTHLQKLYHDESELIVVCLCSHYNQKEWCGLEWRAIRGLLNNKKQNKIMFLRTDTGDVDGIFGTIDGSVPISKDNIDETIALIIERYDLL